MDWLELKDTKTRYIGYMDDVESENFNTKKFTILSWGFDHATGVVSTELGRLTDLRAVNLS